TDNEIGLRKDEVLDRGLTLGRSIYEATNLIWDSGDTPADEDQAQAAKAAKELRTAALRLIQVSSATPEGYTRWLEKQPNFNRYAVRDLTLKAMPFDVSWFIGEMAGWTKVTAERPDYTRCTRCNKPLTAEAVHILGGQPFGPTC